jgi:hypothetical protein
MSLVWTKTPDIRFNHSSHTISLKRPDWLRWQSITHCSLFLSAFVYRSMIHVSNLQNQSSYSSTISVFQVPVLTYSYQLNCRFWSFKKILDSCQFCGFWFLKNIPDSSQFCQFDPSKKKTDSYECCSFDLWRTSCKTNLLLATPNLNRNFEDPKDSTD